MKILLVQPLRYLLPAGGAHKANRLLMEGLQALGHECRAVAVMGFEEETHSVQRFAEQLRERRIPVLSVSPAGVVFRHQGIVVHTVRQALQLGTALLQQLREFEPTHVIVSEDSSLLMLDVAMRDSDARVVFLCHSQTTLPFGPSSFVKMEADTTLLEQADGVLTVSDFVVRYIEAHTGASASVIRLPSYGQGPFPELGNFEQGYVTLINPSIIKGLPIFLALARALPHVPFAAVPTWATTRADIEALEALPNVTLLSPRANVDELFQHVRVLLAPSLWGESFGQVVVEAMLRGIPVLAADAGGLPEAKLGVDYLLPVRPIERYQEEVDERSIPIAEVPEQDITPWRHALEALLGSREEYTRLSQRSRAAAQSFVSGLGFEPIASYLEQLPAKKRADWRARHGGASRQDDPALNQLPSDRRLLLALRLRKKRTAPETP